MSYFARPYLRAVANGVAENGDLRATVIVTPSPGRDSGDADLTKWPSEIAARVKDGNLGAKAPSDYGVMLRLSETDPSKGPHVDIAIETLAAAHKASAAVERWADVAGKWDAAISGKYKDAAWDGLVKTLEQSLDSQSQVAAIDAETPSFRREDVGDDARFLSAAPAQGTTVTIKTVLPIEQAALAMALETQRALDTARLIGCNPEAAGRPAGQSEPHPPTPEKLSDSAVKDAIKGEKLRQLNDHLCFSREARRDAFEEFGNPGMACRPRTGLADFIKDRASLDKSAERARASHEYANWRQGPNDPATAAAPDPFTEKRTDPAAMAHAAQVFYALQSSPGWARIFGLAVDVIIPRDKLPKSWTDPAIKERTIYLAADFGDAKLLRPVVWTAANLRAGHFWPQPIVYQDRAVDQRDGLMLLGHGFNEDRECDPRYDIVTLDIRRGAESGQSGAQTQTYLTAGFTLIDRGRSLEAVRTLRRSSDVADQCGAGANVACRQAVVLYADDITVARRLDIAMPKWEKDGAGPTATWRSLMRRKVTYSFRDDERPKATGKFIDALLGPRGNEARDMVDQATITTVSRLLPRGPVPPSDPPPADSPPAAADPREAVVEEALVTWDGTPLAVYSGPEAPLDDTYISADREEPLPFQMNLDLPDRSDQADGLKLPPPLRYGAQYRLGMRAVYLGGGSLRVADAASAYEENGEFCYPPGPNVKYHANSWRRFLRQEPIGTPTVLLPQGLANAPRPEPMDFEPPNSLVVRTSLAPEPGSELPGPLVNGRPYVPAEDRATPKSTVRVIVPPTVAHDEVLRHGAFDDDVRRKSVKDGGLLHVAYGYPAVDKKGNPIGKAGFPIASVTESVAFGVTKTRKTRAATWPKASGDSTPGTVTFAEMSSFKDKKHAPFFPDPAAEQLLIRLRHRGTAKYVPGFQTVKLYPGSRKYPDVLPVAIEVQAGSPRGGAGPKMNTIATDKGLTRLSDKGTFGKSGLDVNRIILRLAPGDDFELEVSFLPLEDTLARSFVLPESIGALVYGGGGFTCDDPGATETLIGEALAAVLAQKGAAKTSNWLTTGGYPSPPFEHLRLIATALTDTTASVRPVDQLAAVAVLRAAHVVSRPQTAPVFEAATDLPIVEKKPAVIVGPVDVIRPPALTSTKTPIEFAPLEEQVKMLATQEGAKDYLLSGSIDVDLSDSDSFEIIAEAASPRSPLMDDPARRRPLRAKISGKWPKATGESGDRVPASPSSIYGFDIDPATGRVTLPRATAALLRVDALRTEQDENIWKAGAVGQQVSLAMTHQAARLGASVVKSASNKVLFKAAQLHTFPDCKARKLTLRAVAISRFDADFETAPYWNSEGKAAPGVFLRQALAPREMRTTSRPHDVWLPATERPAKCDPEMPLPGFRYETTPSLDKKGRRLTTVERRCLTRIYMRRGWFSSGEGERLGLIIWPPNHLDKPEPPPLGDNAVRLDGRDVSIAELKDEYLGPGGTFVTRWGGDPVRKDLSPESRYLIPPECFLDLHKPQCSAHDPELVTDIEIPVPRTPAQGEKKADDKDKEGEGELLYFRASLLTYAPCFDADREEWYVDIDISPSLATDPFVRFGLVRYQAHAVANRLRASVPVALWSQILPDRTVEVTRAPLPNGDIEVCATIRGQASAGIRELPLPSKEDAKDLWQIRRPLMRMTLVHESGGHPLRRTPLDPGEVPPLHDFPTPKSGLPQWELSGTISASRVAALGPGTVYAYIEEIERRMPATYAHEPVQVADIFTAGTFVESGPRFALKVELDETSSALGNALSDDGG